MFQNCLISNHPHNVQIGLCFLKKHLEPCAGGSDPFCKSVYPVIFADIHDLSRKAPFSSCAEEASWPAAAPSTHSVSCSESLPLLDPLPSATGATVVRVGQSHLVGQLCVANTSG